MLKDGELTAQAAHAAAGAAWNSGRIGPSIDSDAGQGLGTGLGEAGTMSEESCAGHVLRIGDAYAADAMDAVDAIDATEASGAANTADVSVSVALGQHSLSADTHTGIWLERRM